MKIFDTKDSKVSSRNSGSFHRKHSVLEESHSDFSEVSNRKFESLLRKDPNSECSHDWVCEVLFESLKVSIGNIPKWKSHPMISP